MHLLAECDNRPGILRIQAVRVAEGSVRVPVGAGGVGRGMMRALAADGPWRFVRPWKGEGLYRFLVPEPQEFRKGVHMRDPALWQCDPIKLPLLVIVARRPFWGPDHEKYVRNTAVLAAFCEGGGSFA